MEINTEIKAKAPQILAEIQKAKSILLHCHPSPDPDSVCSALAMKFALESLGKKVTVIQGDSPIPDAFMHFPGAKDILKNNFLEINQSDFDLFIVLDSASLDRITSKAPINILNSLKLINIDHHKTNPNFGMINLVVSSYPATAQILFDLFNEWKIVIDRNIATNLFMGIYTDTGGLKYSGTTPQTFAVAGELVKIAPDFQKIISDMENSNTPDFITFQGLSFNSLETYLDGKLAMTSVSNESLVEKGINAKEISSSDISSILRTVIGWDIDVALVEYEPGKNKASFRTRDENKYDVSRLAASLGGGGHKAAAGATLIMCLEDAKKKVVEKVKELYNL